MSLSARWHRLDASAWVHRLLVLEVGLLVLASALAAIGGLVLGAPLMWVLPAAMAGVAGWIARAWNEDRRWSWWVVMAMAALGAGSHLLDLASGFSWWQVARLLLCAVLLALLLHPDSTARLRSRPRPTRAPRWVPEQPPLR